MHSSVAKRAAWKRAAVVILSALSGAALAHAATGGPSPSEAASPRGPAEPPPPPSHPQTADPEPATPPAPMVDDSAAPEPDPERAAAPAPRPHDPMGARFAEGRVLTGATPHRLILFTFDDGPDPRYTPRLLDILDEHGIKAVFFMTAGRIAPDTPWGRRQAELAREVARRGHLIGNHTLDHSQLPLLDNVAVREQLTASERIFERVFGARPWLLRPPGGARSERVDGLVEERGYTQMLWNLGAGDAQVDSPEQVVETWKAVFERRREENGERGGIILLHDIHEWSVQAVPKIVGTIRERNCALLERGEALYDIVDDPSLFFQGREPDDAAGKPAAPARPDPQTLAVRQEHARAEARAYCTRASSR